jgi:hypothetical protein
MLKFQTETLPSNAKRQGYHLRKSRRRQSPDDLGAYCLIDAETNFIVLGEHFEASLAEIADFLRPAATFAKATSNAVVYSAPS